MRSLKLPETRGPHTNNGRVESQRGLDLENIANPRIKFLISV